MSGEEFLDDFSEVGAAQQPNIRGITFILDNPTPQD